jgi:hypothetical protein
MTLLIGATPNHHPIRSYCVNPLPWRTDATKTVAEPGRVS